MALKRSTLEESYGRGIGTSDLGSSSYHYGSKSGLKLVQEDVYASGNLIDYTYASAGSDHFHHTQIRKDIDSVKQRRSK